MQSFTTREQVSVPSSLIPFVRGFSSYFILIKNSYS